MWLLHWLFAMAAVVVLALTFLVSKTYGLLFLMLALGFCLVFAIRWIHSRSVSCPLCHGKLLHGSKCHKHIDARRHSLFTYTSSLDVVLSGKFICMYCGTPFRLRR